MPGRKYEVQSGYRYGFNGKEKDKDLNSLTAYDYGFRIYNPGIGKFLSVDPLTQSYPWYSPFHFAGNQPIVAIDLDGAEPKWLQDALEFFGAGPKKVNSEVESTSRLVTNQAAFKESLPDQINGGPGGIARELIINNQNVKDYSNASDYFVRPYKITNFVAETIYPSAQLLNGGYSITRGNYISGGIDILAGGLGSKSRAAENLLGNLFKSPINITGWLKSAGVETFTLIKGVKGGKVAVIGQGMDKVIKVAEGLRNPEVFKPSENAIKQWNKLLADNPGKILSEDVVKGTQIYKENESWIKMVKSEGYDVLDTGGGSTSTFYNMEKQTVYGPSKQ